MPTPSLSELHVRKDRLSAQLASARATVVSLEAEHTAAHLEDRESGAIAGLAHKLREARTLAEGLERAATAATTDYEAANAAENRRHAIAAVPLAEAHHAETLARVAGKQRELYHRARAVLGTFAAEVAELDRLHATAAGALKAAHAAHGAIGRPFDRGENYNHDRFDFSGHPFDAQICNALAGLADGLRAPSAPPLPALPEGARAA